MVYIVTFTINIPPMLAYIPYMDPMGGNVNHSNSGVFLKYWFTSLQGDAWPPPGVVEDVMKKTTLALLSMSDSLGNLVGFIRIRFCNFHPCPIHFHPFSIHLVVHVVAFLGTTWGVGTVGNPSGSPPRRCRTTRTLGGCRITPSHGCR